MLDGDDNTLGREPTGNALLPCATFHTWRRLSMRAEMVVINARAKSSNPRSCHERNTRKLTRRCVAYTSGCVGAGG